MTMPKKTLCGVCRFHIAECWHEGEPFCRACRDKERELMPQPTPKTTYLDEDDEDLPDVLDDDHFLFERHLQLLMAATSQPRACRRRKVG